MAAQSPSCLWVGLRLVALVLLLRAGVTCSAPEDDKDMKHYNIVLIGATGDLATKYLWRSLFDIFSNQYQKGKTHFAIYACSRQSQNDGRQALSNILLNVVKCAQGDDTCRGMKAKFVEASQFYQLKNDEQFEKLAKLMNGNTQSMYGLQNTPKTYEVGRLIYMSIPPSAYAVTARRASEYLRPVIGRPWFRVVLEKPFGHDYTSAKALAAKLAKALPEQEIYRVDHYLGKALVDYVLPFRLQNRETYEKMWNRDHIDRVEIVMKEKADAKDRTLFYEEVGVVRDVMQNHMTEMLVLVAMDLPRDSGNISAVLEAKRRVLSHMEPVTDQSLLLGQYASYRQECEHEATDPIASCKPSTATFGAAVVAINNARWQGVPFVLTTGKKLDEKFSYIRVVFKDGRHCLARSDVCGAGGGRGKHMVFHVSSSDLLASAMVTASPSLPRPRQSDGWALNAPRLNAQGDEPVHWGEPLSEYWRLVPAEDPDPYTRLLEAVMGGYRHMFVDQRQLLLAWKVWSPVLASIDRRRPRIYHGGIRDPDLLDFEVLGNRRLRYLKDDDVTDGDGDMAADLLHQPGSSQPLMRHIPADFRGSQLVSGTADDVIAKLATDIQTVADSAILERGAFHLALSGGRSPVALLQYMVGALYGFPWAHTHVWQVDERCVAPGAALSNMATLSRHLLERVPLPYANVHPLPVHLMGRACGEEDLGDRMYQADIEHLVHNASLDFVLLGVGADCHTASLFPGQPAVGEHERLVVYAQGGPPESPRRMTLTLPAINRAHYVGVLLTGAGKADMVKRLAEAEDSDVTPDLCPALGVQPQNGTLIWYMDHEAMLPPVV